MQYVVIGRGGEQIVSNTQWHRVAFFETVEAFEEWRHRSAFERTVSTVAEDVGRVLSDLGVPNDAVPAALRRVVTHLCDCAVVPHVQDLVPNGMSESTFYRRWHATFALSPRQFLERVRVAHARRLLETWHLPLKETAYRTGFASTWHLRTRLEAQSRNRSSSAA